MNALGLKILKSFEGCKLTAYQDQGGVWTIGWGHTGPEVMEGLTWTQDQADGMLEQQIEHFSSAVYIMVTAMLNDDQLSALTDFAYNEGAHALQTSTLLRKINSGEFDVESEFLRWDYEAGKVNKGLLSRRKAEASLFASDYATLHALLDARS